MREGSGEGEGRRARSRCRGTYTAYTYMLTYTYMCRVLTYTYMCLDIYGLDGLDSQGQILALGLRQQSLKRVQVFPLRSDTALALEVDPLEPLHPAPHREREFFIDNLLVRVHRCFWCTGLAPWEFESPFPGSLISTFLRCVFPPKRPRKYAFSGEKLCWRA